MTSANASLSAEPAEEYTKSVNKEEAPESGFIVKALSSFFYIGASAERTMNKFIHFHHTAILLVP